MTKQSSNRITKHSTYRASPESIRLFPRPFPEISVTSSFPRRRQFPWEPPGGRTRVKRGGVPRTRSPLASNWAVRGAQTSPDRSDNKRSLRHHRLSTRCASSQFSKSDRRRFEPIV